METLSFVIRPNYHFIRLLAVSSRVDVIINDNEKQKHERKCDKNGNMKMVNKGHKCLRRRQRCWCVYVYVSISRQSTSASAKQRQLFDTETSDKRRSILETISLASSLASFIPIRNGDKNENDSTMTTANREKVAERERDKFCVVLVWPESYVIRLQ